MVEISRLELNGRKSVLLQDSDGMFVVDLFKNDIHHKRVPLPGKNRYYADDACENWVTGIGVYHELR